MKQEVLPPISNSNGSEINAYPPPGIDADGKPLWSLGLTDNEYRFVEHYVRYRNATQAYTHAYDSQATYETRRVAGGKVLRREHVAAAIRARQAEGTKQAGVDVAWLLNRFLDIATADPRELIGLKVGCCRHCYGEGHGYQWREHEFIAECNRVDQENRALKAVRRSPDVPYPDIAGGLGFNATYAPVDDCPKCHGEGLERFVPRDTDTLSDQALLLYGGVKVKADGGYEIIIADRGKALDFVGKIMGAYTENMRHSGVVGALVSVQEIKKMDPQDAARAYREMIAAHVS